MFIVYSPEGQSFIGAAQNLPVLKVDPAKRINKPEAAGMDALKEDTNSDAHGYSSQAMALNAYKENQTGHIRQVIVKVAELMTSPVVTTNVDSNLEEVWQLMQEKGVKHLPVLDRGELVGMCSQSQILARVIVNKEGRLEGVKPELVSDIMQTEVVTTSLDTDVRHVAQALSHYQIDALVIMSDYHQVLGIVTESDLIKRLANDPPLELYT